jgi:mycothiol synthase
MWRMAEGNASGFMKLPCYGILREQRKAMQENTALTHVPTGRQLHKEHMALDALWTTSQTSDDGGFQPNGGWWSLAAWAEVVWLLWEHDTLIGAAALARAPDGSAEGRLVLDPARRTPAHAYKLVQAALQHVHQLGAAAIRLALPQRAVWAQESALAADFRVVRSTLLMSRPTALALPPLTLPPTYCIRPVADHEHERLRTALNRAWAATWNAQPITEQMLADDLARHPTGFFVAVATATNEFMGTVHAQFDRTAQNPDGTPYGWIANLTSDPAWRGQGLGRALLTWGIAHLHAQGAQSVTLGVDGGAHVPVQLYRSIGFREIDRLDFWERAVGVAPTEDVPRDLPEPEPPHQVVKSHD